MRGISYVGIELGKLICSAGQTESGIEMLERSQQGFEKLGKIDQARQIEAIIG